MIIKIKPLSINAAFQGRRFKSPAYKLFEEEFLLIAPHREMIKGKVGIEYKFHLKNHKMADYDNCIKTTQDLIVRKGYIEDDRKIYEAKITKVPSDEDYIEFRIYKIN